MQRKKINLKNKRELPEKDNFKRCMHNQNTRERKKKKMEQEQKKYLK